MRTEEEWKSEKTGWRGTYEANNYYNYYYYALNYFLELIKRLIMNWIFVIMSHLYPCVIVLYFGVG